MTSFGEDARPEPDADPRESPVDRAIRRAQAAGAFDRLPGAGKPLALEPDPHTPQDLQLAYHILKNAGYRPAWLEKRRSIEADLERFRSGLRAMIEAQSGGDLSPAALERLGDQLDALNKHIALLNLEVPLPVFQLPLVRLDRELERINPAA